MMKSLMILAGLLGILVIAPPATAAQAKTASTAKTTVLAPPPNDFLSRLRTKAIKRTVSACTGHSSPWYCVSYHVRSCWNTGYGDGFCTAWYKVRNATTSTLRCFDGRISGRWNGTDIDIYEVVFNWKPLSYCTG